jgi:hypothetical protein
MLSPKQKSKDLRIDVQSTGTSEEAVPCGRLPHDCRKWLQAVSCGKLPQEEPLKN